MFVELYLKVVCVNLLGRKSFVSPTTQTLVLSLNSFSHTVFLFGFSLFPLQGQHLAMGEQWQKMQCLENTKYEAEGSAGFASW